MNYPFTAARAFFCWASVTISGCSRDWFLNGIQVVAEGSTMHLPKPFAQNHLLLAVRIAELSTSKAYSETENPHRGLIQHLIALGFRASVKVTRRVSNKDLGSGLGVTKKLAHRKDWRYCYLASKLNSPRLQYP